jgi:hypothetical protein
LPGDPLSSPTAVDSQPGNRVREQEENAFSTAPLSMGKFIRKMKSTFRPVFRDSSLKRLFSRRLARPAAFAAVCFFGVLPVWAKEHKKPEHYGLVFSSEVAAPESDVLQAVDYVLNDGMIEGSKEYNKDRFIDKASPALDSPLFEKWTEPGKVFYKVRENVLAPVNFKDSNDEGTLAVRYIVQTKTATTTIVRIDAVFVEEFRRVPHASNGSVESAEFKAIEDRVEAIELDKKRDAEAGKHRAEVLAQRALEKKQEQDEALALANSEMSADTLQAHVKELRQKVERVVKAPGAQLKSAPFHSATSLRSLEAGSDVVILVSTQYWYGVETEDGQHGWVNRAQVESLP